MVLMIMMVLMIPIIAVGVSGDMTRVNKLRKKRVAFGLRTFVRKPIFTADIADISSFLWCSPSSIFDDFDRTDFTPI